MRRSCFLNKVASLQLDTLFKKDSGAVNFFRLFIDINIFFIEKLRVTATKCNFREVFSFSHGESFSVS